MDPPRFVNHYRKLFSWLRVCGLSTPWLQKRSLLSRLPFYFYDGFVLTFVSYTIFCQVYTTIATTISFQDLCIYGISASCYICGVLITFYLMRFRHSLKRITDDMDTIIDNILRNDLGESEFLQQLYQKNSKLMTVLTNNSIIISLLTPFLYIWSVPVMDWMAGQYRATQVINVVSLFDDRAPVVYELMALLFSCSIAISTAKKSIIDCLFMSLFTIQIGFLKYLSVAKETMERQYLVGDSAVMSRKLLCWARLHQDILRNIEDLIEVFAPVVIIYSVTVINIVVCGAFVQIKIDSTNPIQAMSIGSYVFITIIYYFLLSNITGELTTEAQKLAFVAYNVPWYQMKKTNANIILMIICKSNRPVHVTAYKAPVFLLNRETFGAFMVTVISAFVTFCQIKDRYE